MRNYLICWLKTSKIFNYYLFPFFYAVDTWFYYLNFIIYHFLWHSSISALFMWTESLLDNERSTVWDYLIELIIFLIIWILIDLLLYFLWKYLSKYVKTKFERKNLFYIFFRFVPIIWIFSVFMWALLSKEFNYKKDFIKIFIWNILFIVVNVIFWVSMKQLCWFFTE